MPNLGPGEILSFAADIPAISAAALKITSLIDNPSTSRDAIVNLIKADEVVFAQCFKHANSASVSSMREYKSISEIVDILGFNHIKKTCLFLSAKSITNDPKIWFESVFTAVAAHYFARKSGMSVIESDKVYMAALFMNYGAFVLSQNFPNLYAKVTLLNDFKLRLKAEKEEFGVTYLDVSEIILRKYGIPEYVLGIIKKQKDIYSGEYSRENVLIEVARVLCSIQDLDFDSIRARLDLRVIEDIVSKHNVNIKDFDDDSLSRIKNETKEFSYRK